jgi:di/tripeptidase
MRTIGTVVRGVRAPIIREGDNIAEVAAASVMEAWKEAGIEPRDRDVVAVTESVVARAQGNYATLDQIAKDVREKTGGGTVGERSNYPGWQYDRSSALRKEVEEVYRDLTGRDGKIEATHGGLECGLFIEKIPGLDALSMGPELHDVHSVNERLNVASTERVYKLVCEVLRRSK